jgi:hypothetical protein
MDTIDIRLNAQLPLPHNVKLSHSYTKTHSKEIALRAFDDSIAPKQGLFFRVYDMLKILFTDILPANLRSLLPNALSWAYRTVWTGAVRSYIVKSAMSSSFARLFVHGQVGLGSDGCISAILLLPGEHSHPMTMLHLADIAQAEGRSVFSIHLPYNDENPESHRSLLRESIDQISQIVIDHGGTLSDLILVGHSRGALEAVNEAYVENNLKINGVISLAGRLEVVKDSSRPCRQSLRASVYSVWKKLHNRHHILRVPLYQIAAIKDWCMDPEASIVRLDHSHLSVDAGHLGVISHPHTLTQFKTWIHK